MSCSCFLQKANSYRKAIKAAKRLKHFYITHLRHYEYKKLEKRIDKEITRFKQKVDYFDKLAVRNKEI